MPQNRCQTKKGCREYPDVTAFAAAPWRGIEIDFPSVHPVVKLFKQAAECRGTSGSMETGQSDTVSQVTSLRRSTVIAGARAERGGSRKSVSLRDVAKMAKVSVATVSMVLNDNPRISRATHLRVQRLMDRMGYQPNRLAQSLSGR